MYRKREVNKVNTILVKFGKAVGKVTTQIEKRLLDIRNE